MKLSKSRSIFEHLLGTACGAVEPPGSSNRVSEARSASMAQRTTYRSLLVFEKFACSVSDDGEMNLCYLLLILALFPGTVPAPVKRVGRRAVRTKGPTHVELFPQNCGVILQSRDDGAFKALLKFRHAAHVVVDRLFSILTALLEEVGVLGEQSFHLTVLLMQHPLRLADPHRQDSA